MSQIYVERIIGLLATDEALRRQFTKNPAETLEKLIERGMELNWCERESLAAAKAAVTGAKGAYDPVLGLDGAWAKNSEPVNSSLSGTSPGQLGPELKSAEAGVALQQLLPTGGALSLRARGVRETTE